MNIDDSGKRDGEDECMADENRSSSKAEWTRKERRAGRNRMTNQDCRCTLATAAGL